MALLRKTKKDYYGKLNPKKIKDNRTFWRTVELFLFIKSIINEKITLLENDEFFVNDKPVAKVLNSFFSRNPWVQAK